MKKAIPAFCVTVLAAALTAMSLHYKPPERPEKEVTAKSAVPDDRASPRETDVYIERGKSLITHAPSEAQGYNLLATAYLQKARETGDFGLNARAATAIERSLEVAPNNYDAIKLKAVLLLTCHRFEEALVVAREARRLRPADPMVYGAMVDALVELGRYPEAMDAAKRMLSLRPDTESYARLSYLKSLHGEPDSAIDLMREAVRLATNREHRAWCYVHLADELLNRGDVGEALEQYDAALNLMPDYHLALAGKGRAFARSGDLSAAVAFFSLAIERAPLPDVAVALGDVHAKVGRHEEAERQYRLVEFVETTAEYGSQTYSRVLALFWANHGKNLSRALDIAKRERAVRSDIYTCDLLAWCLFKNGHPDEARKAVVEALRLGTSDALIHYHAGMIFHALGDKRTAARHLARALEINPGFDVLQADTARSTLQEVRGER